MACGERGALVEHSCQPRLSPQTVYSSLVYDPFNVYKINLSDDHYILLITAHLIFVNEHMPYTENKFCCTVLSKNLYYSIRILCVSERIIHFYLFIYFNKNDPITVSKVVKYNLSWSLTFCN